MEAYVADTVVRLGWPQLVDVQPQVWSEAKPVARTLKTGSPLPSDRANR
jgi:hypothetical protein